jgi:DtxR family Mn-dependent transcriptional regulator
MSKQEKLSASLEDYLEVIYQLSQGDGGVKSRDIAANLEVSRASVTGALQSLGKRGLINYAPYDEITLTEEGRVMASDVVKRHTALKTFFEDVLCIESDIAEKTACLMEHAMHPLVLARMEEYLAFIKTDGASGFSYREGVGFGYE